MTRFTIILYGYKTIGTASYPLSINDAKHPLTILKRIHTTDEKMTILLQVYLCAVLQLIFKRL
ncbi:hypothetical protein DSH38_14600 [Escherichia coli]|nr:hypothetical protein [Escherichia coli]EFN5143637.1 hypothetical protein [Escherichia coli]EFN5806643.1 hypothetical protein [Escherichia coli]EFO2278323.1 hypothetical protein [Escherichia coli]MDN1909844.1 hypothetical protein [Escherichia coli]